MNALFLIIPAVPWPLIQLQEPVVAHSSRAHLQEFNTYTVPMPNRNTCCSWRLFTVHRGKLLVKFTSHLLRKEELMVPKGERANN